jgi:hypothetical protein
MLVNSHNILQYGWFIFPITTLSNKCFGRSIGIERLTWLVHEPECQAD